MTESAVSRWDVLGLGSTSVDELLYQSCAIAAAYHCYLLLQTDKITDNAFRRKSMACVLITRLHDTRIAKSKPIQRLRTEQLKIGALDRSGFENNLCLSLVQP